MVPIASMLYCVHFITLKGQIMTREDVIQWALRHNFTPDKFGHFQKQDKDGSKLRIKMQDYSIRYERKSIGYGQWFNIRSEYICHLTVNPETDKLVFSRK